MSKPATSKHNDETPALAITHVFHAAFIETREARAALTPAERMPVNLDVRIAVTTVLGVLPRLARFRSAIVSALPEHDVTKLDNLGTYAEALAHAHGVYLAASEASEPLQALVARAAGMRRQLLSDAKALARRGLLDGRRLAELKGSIGYLNTSSDLGVLVYMLRDRWADIATRSAIEPAELDEAEHLHERITLGYAERARPSTAVAIANDDRQRAFTLLVRAYDHVRRAVAYLRWEEKDCDRLAPSLWAGRGARAAGSGVSASRRRPTPGVRPTAAASAENSSSKVAPAIDSAHPSVSHRDEE